ncbi:hypothetical protein SAMN05216328_13736 [Ensifer sp. YR511]|nr:hypothetical protein SAMN05216328_13736 [Ensifer sp. YR511]
MGAATAEMVSQRFANIAFIRLGIALEQPDCGDDHAIETIAALRRRFLYEGPLHRMQISGRRQPLERGYAPCPDRTKRHGTGPDRTTIYQNSASAAFTKATTVFRAVQGKVVPQNVKERCFRLCINVPEGVVDVQ